DVSAGKAAPDKDATAGQGAAGKDVSAGKGGPGKDDTAGKGAAGKSGAAGNGGPGKDDTGSKGAAGKNGAAGKGASDKDSTAGKGAAGKSVSAGKGGPGKDATAGKGAAGKDVSAGKAAPDKDATAGKGAAGKDISAGKGGPGKDDTGSKGAAGKSGAAGKGASDKDSTAGKGAAGKNVSAGKDASGKDSTAGKAAAGKNGTAGKGASGKDDTAGKGVAGKGTSSGKDASSGTDASSSKGTAAGKGKQRVVLAAEGNNDVELRMSQASSAPISGMVSESREPTLFGLPWPWVRALKIVLEITQLGPLAPDRISDHAFLRLLPLQITEEYGRGPGQLEADPLLAAVQVIERSHYLTTSRALQELIDACHFSDVYRRAHIQSKNTKDAAKRLAEYLEGRQGVPVSIFGDGALGTSKKPDVLDQNIKTLHSVGSRLLGLCAILGSTAFLPILSLSPAFRTPTKIRDMGQDTLSALSLLLRGGAPDLSQVQRPDVIRFAEAGIFAAHITIPRALNHFMAAACRLRDAHRHDISSSLFVSSSIKLFTHCPHLPQPLLFRAAEDGEDSGLVFGLTSGYGDQRRAVTTLPTWMLTKNYYKFEPNDPTKATKRLRDLFSHATPAVDKESIAQDNTPNVQLECPITEARSLRDSYAAFFGLSVQDPGLLSILDSVKANDLLLQAEPPIPSRDYLRKRNPDLILDLDQQMPAAHTNAITQFDTPHALASLDVLLSKRPPAGKAAISSPNPADTASQAIEIDEEPDDSDAEVEGDHDADSIAAE
ncbi:hypothetical protein OC844_007414, partial [Tilletia horrida]